MDNLCVKVSDFLQKLCRKNKTCGHKIQRFLAKQIWNSGDREDVLNTLAELFLVPGCSSDVTEECSPIMLDIFIRAKKRIEKKWSMENHQYLFVALSKALTLCPDALRFTIEYCRSKPAPFEETTTAKEPLSKKPRKSKGTEKLAPKELVEATYWLTYFAREDVKRMWNWKPFLNFLKSEDVKIKWFATLTIGTLVDMTDSQMETFQKQYIDKDTFIKLRIRHNVELQKIAAGHVQIYGDKSEERLDENVSHTMGHLVERDLTEDVVAVCGILINNIQSDSKQEVDNSKFLIPVDSTQRNLRSLSLAVAVGSPVLLQGPVGSGKTALVEHLAALTGRMKTPHLIKVQLGDQTDSKALLGTYRCTDIPGEFLWQPGTLTQAVMEGRWILLEDIDYAPMDVISTLVPLLQSNTLSIPGHGDSVKAAPGFQLFATQRLLTGISGLYTLQNSNSTMLERMWSLINVEPMSRGELKEVITSRYPQLNSVSERLLDIYFLLSAGQHESSMVAMDTELDETVGQFLSHDGRLISTRDLMKWCHRIAEDFNITSSATGNLVFQEALDCFCACLPKLEQRLPLAEAIGAKLNITKVKAEYYCCKYKPNVELTATTLTLGRASLQRVQEETMKMKKLKTNFAFTQPSVALLERIAVCVENNEPVLLVGETGTGKTSTVQYLASQSGQSLRVVNMNQQSDRTDLLGGYKPVDLRHLVAPLREDFEILFCSSFSRKQNIKFLKHVQECFSRRRWPDLFKLMEHSHGAALKKYASDNTSREKWRQLGLRLQQMKIQVKHTENTLAFSFIEGTLVQAIKCGDWVLLDEINLASAETLECLGGLLESNAGSLVLLERGDTEPIERHPDFRLFACMNPATDVGKK
ncbi:unnamed protein product, partial [Owenia fusiformis]